MTRKAQILESIYGAYREIAEQEGRIFTDIRALSENADINEDRADQLSLWEEAWTARKAGNSWEERNVRSDIATNLNYFKENKHLVLQKFQRINRAGTSSATNGLQMSHGTAPDTGTRTPTLASTSNPTNTANSSNPERPTSGHSLYLPPSSPAATSCNPNELQTLDSVSQNARQQVQSILGNSRISNNEKTAQILSAFGMKAPTRRSEFSRDVPQSPWARMSTVSACA